MNDEVKAAAMQLLVRVKGNFAAANSVIAEWTKKGEGFFGTLKLVSQVLAWRERSSTVCDVTR